jgi:hypothetical protein
MMSASGAPSVAPEGGTVGGGGDRRDGGWQGLGGRAAASDIGEPAVQLAIGLESGCRGAGRVGAGFFRADWGDGAGG